MTVTASLMVLRSTISSLILDTGASNSRLPVMSDFSIPVSSFTTKDNLNVPLSMFSKLTRWTSISMFAEKLRRCTSLIELNLYSPSGDGCLQTELISCELQFLDGIFENQSCVSFANSFYTILAPCLKNRELWCNETISLFRNSIYLLG